MDKYWVKSCLKDKIGSCHTDKPYSIVVIQTEKEGGRDLNKLKYFRVMSGMTLEDLSKVTSISIGHLSHLENGTRENPTKETMDKVAAAFEKTVPEVFFTELTAEEEQELAEKCHYVVSTDEKHTKEEGGDPVV